MNLRIDARLWRSSLQDGLFGLPADLSCWLLGGSLINPSTVVPLSCFIAIASLSVSLGLTFCGDSPIVGLRLLAWFEEIVT